ncbi:DUF1836 domain-containing protein [Thermoclostridium caenicola]|uniref:DUF1836 domain-containing protein n=1 Tax=Thermoclostridium caenicola TaxID=659425 RepID=A0A1M6H4Z7_9FIRM|nr:DUF1836 domain-containing protein [Thermoclostridium caenicola]SHJ17159.1 protein of unknown function [Thermoclostridium caenicola]
MEPDGIRKEMDTWFSDLKDHRTPDWDALPDLDLYMDQVITYLERQLRIFSLDGEDRLITSSMINNYVKHNLMPRPVQKKYSREHLAYLIAISALKEVLPITDISNIIRHQTESTDMVEFYNRFRSIQDDVLRATARRVEEEFLKNHEDTGSAADALGMLALKLAYEAGANILAAKRLIRMLCSPEKTQGNPEKDKGSDRKPDKKKKTALVESGSSNNPE